MKHKIIDCDICYKDIARDSKRYKIKCNEELSSFSRKRTKLYMCEECFKKFQQFVKEERNKPITTEEQFDAVVNRIFKLLR
mgnify:FL=1|nr:MAG TPA: Monocytic leukemia zinc finger protein finger, acetyl transferase, DNA [Caudoviricetes sp.]